MTHNLQWGDGSLTIELQWDAESSVSLAALVTKEGKRSLSQKVPFVEVLTVEAGHTSVSSRIDHTVVGRDLRYVRHEEHNEASLQRLTLTQEAADLAVTVITELISPNGSGAIRATNTVENRGTRPLILRAVSSWSSAFTEAIEAGDALDGWVLLSGRNEWLGEGRWQERGVRNELLPRIYEELTGHDPRGSHSETSYGTWSTSGSLPVAGIENVGAKLAWAWQVEHNGGWRWDVAENTGAGVITLAGPTDLDHAWSAVLQPGESFESVPAAVAVGDTFTAAIGALTEYRRRMRLPHVDNAAMPVVFNDYMNTLDGDPTTERLLPLIDAAAAAGAEIFCIDAGWYDDGGWWWPSVGEWKPSTVRFPNGLREVIDRILSHAMVPGLWLEPEVIGVKSPVAGALPDEAFLQRSGQRIEQHERFHLDLRHPAAVAHLDEVVDRLVDEFDVGFFKFDYNINPGVGTDLNAVSPGDGLLQHNRAHLAWLDRLYERHPELVIESCSSGAMRTDFAVLSRTQMQSTSDQQEFRSYPPIAVTAPLVMLPEQAASWAYPQPDMNLEEVAFCLVTGLLGRFYLSGYLNRMDEDQLALVRESIAVAKGLRHELVASTPSWPTGLPGWTDEWTSLALTSGAETRVSVWHRGETAGSTTLSFPSLAGQDLSVEVLFPTTLAAWRTEWFAGSGSLVVHAPAGGPAARVFTLTSAVHLSPTNSSTSLV
ncbi:glycoside hydrolase family 36 protein [Pseudoclavibacter sp. AY1F1]|uniref:glycoside hydrolase family 36 protein n=1 Tax=Pseudoclavibacter sp. AY1F1 TaxID=2080583 RepID=UPI0021570AE1|nr:glycoside hydrolase family 36 protein [Pseudoclavibacter sp. AY1F1]